MFGRWAELVGDEVADHCTPESFADGRLIVRTDSTAWATQLKLLAPTVVDGSTPSSAHGTVTVIEVLGPHLPALDEGPAVSRDGRGPARHLRLSEAVRERPDLDLRASRR